MSVVYISPDTPEPLEAIAVDGSGALLTGLTTLRVRLLRVSDAGVYDWDDGVFKTSGLVEPLGTLVEVHATNAPGRYRLVWPGGAAGTYEALITQTGIEAVGLPQGISLRVGALATATAVAAVQTDVDDIQARLPAALVGGRIDASAGAIAANAITAAAIATAAIDADALAADAASAIAAVVESVLGAAHGAGSWATATGYAVPGDGMTLTSGERTAVASAVWAAAEDNPSVGTFGYAVKLTRQWITNRVWVTAGSSGNMVLYADDASTSLLTWSVADGTGAAVTTPTGSPARRSAAT